MFIIGPRRAAVIVVLGCAMMAISSAGARVLDADFNNDGHIDLIVGAVWEDIGAIEDAGAVTVFYGYADGLSHAAVAFLANPVPASDAFFGWALAAGDFDGDHFPDLAIGHPLHRVGGAYGGAVTVVFGDADGVNSMRRRELWHQDSPGVPGDPEDYDNFGWSLAAADVSGDEIDDLVVGIPGEGIRKYLNVRHEAGVVLVLYGSLGGLYARGHDDPNPSNINEDAFTFIYDAARPTPADLDSNESAGIGAGDRFGESLAISRRSFSSDHLFLLVGTPGEEDVGAVYLIPARSIFFRPIYKLWQGPANAVPPGRREDGDDFGSVLP